MAGDGRAPRATRRRADRNRARPRGDDGVGVTIEAFLARVYVDTAYRDAFLADPVGAARRAGLPESVARVLATVDAAGVRMQAASFDAKRRGRTSGA